MKRVVCKALSVILLVIIFVLNLPSCSKNPDAVKDGITVLPGASQQISDSARNVGREVVLELLRQYYESEGTAPTDELILSKCEKILGITLEIPIGDEKYLDFMDLVEKRGVELISELRSPSEKTVETVLDIYLEISSLVSSEYAGSVLYGFALFAYDEVYSDYITKYQTTGKVQYKILANDIKEKKEIFTATIDKEDCALLCELSFFVCNLFVGDAFNTGSVASLLDAEILILLEQFDFSELSVEPEGYALLLGLYADTLIIREEVAYVEELLYEANYNGDGERISEIMSELIALLSSVKESLTKEDIGLLRQGEIKAMLSNVFSRFGDGEYELIEKFASSIQKKNTYDKVAVRYFADDYTAYKGKLSAKTLDELRLSVGTDEFYDTLEGYIFGISPAFSYGMSNDRD